MHLKRYRRETLQEALRAVREDLGPQALVLSTRMVPASGVRGWLGTREVEISAAAERPQVSENRRERPADRPESRATAEIAARLEAVGLDAALAREIAAAHPVSRRRAATAESLAETLAAQLAPLAAGEVAYAPVEVFIGPPGVGKTTTVAKIAARERARQGQRLTLLSADGFRVGAVEQLRLYADIIGAPFAVARTPDELQRALDMARRPLLLDTAGRSPSDDVSRDMFRALRTRTDVRTHLVMAASTPAPLARRVFERFAEARPSRLVLTKLDEVDSIAPLLNIIREQQLPLSFFGTGQRVPEDLQPVTAARLAAWVMGEADARQGAVA